jgi:hypothetical protein
MGLKKTGFNGAPLAPHTVRWTTYLKISLRGRRDAKKYSGLKDFTRTHALITAQSLAQAGQHRVNQWLIESLDPLIAGNERISVQEEELNEQISALRAQKSASGRDSRFSQRKAAELAELRSNLRSQRKSNTATMESLTLSAQEALGSWETYYEQIASLYSRARAVKGKAEISKVASEVPVFTSIELAVTNFEKPLNETRRTRGAK